MNLSPKSIQMLIDIKKELLSKSVMITPELPPVSVLPVLSVQAAIAPRSGVMITSKSTQVMRHARVRGRAVQQMYQRGEL
jgi:hypothetical protein